MFSHIINSIQDTFSIYDYLILLVFMFYTFSIIKDIKNLKPNEFIVYKIAKMFYFACMLFIYFLIGYVIIQPNLIVLFPLGIVCFLAGLTIQKTIKGDESNMQLVTSVLNDIRENHPYSFNLILSILFSIGIISVLDFSFLGTSKVWYKLLFILGLGISLYIISLVEVKISKRKKLLKENLLKEEAFLTEIKTCLEKDILLIESYILNRETDKAISFVKIRKTRKVNEMFRLDISLDLTNKKIIFEIKDNDDNTKMTDILNYDV